LELLQANLKRGGYSEAHISAALQKLLAAADGTGITLYHQQPLIIFGNERVIACRDLELFEVRPPSCAVPTR
jgi:hypothetical protein